MKREIQNKKRYVLAFLIGTLIFINGFLLTYAFSYFEYNRISNLQEQVSYQIFKDKLEYSIFNKNICDSDSFEQISESLRFQGQMMDRLEQKFGKNNKKVLFKKNFYTLVELEHFDFIKQMNKQCGSNISVILFFYSNEDKDLEISEETGKLLDAVVQRNSDIVIYSFDINLEDDLIKELKQKYEIQTSPTIIVNEQNKIESPENAGQIEKYLISS